METLFFVLLAIFILILLSGGYVFFYACGSWKEYPWLEPEKLKNTPYEKYADHIQNSARWLSDHDAQDVYIQSDDGLRLHGLWVRAKNPVGTVLLAHGYRSTMLVDFGLIFEVYHQLNMNLLVPEQRCHGQSQGRYITFGVKESRDMENWILFHNQELSCCPIFISGLSMGASTMMYLADRKLPDNVKGLIVDCGFTSPAAIIAKVFTSTTRMPAYPTIWAADLFARVFAGFSLYERDSRDTLAHTQYPILMVHGKSDDFVPPEMSEQGYAACTGEKDLLLVDDAGHGVSFLRQPERYQQMVEAFVRKHLEGVQ